MANKRIPWDNEQEIERLKELFAENSDFEEITKSLNKEFRETRPKNENGKRMKRSRDSVYWFHQRLTRKEDPERKPVTRRRKSNSSIDISAPQNGYKITVRDSTGAIVCLFTTEKSIDAINSSLKELF